MVLRGLSWEVLKMGQGWGLEVSLNDYGLESPGPPSFTRLGVNVAVRWSLSWAVRQGTCVRHLHVA